MKPDKADHGQPHPRRSPPAAVPAPTGTPLQRLNQWFQTQGRQPRPYQRKAWRAYRDGASGLIHVPTGAGKTYAALMGPLLQMMTPASGLPGAGLRLLYITPLRSLSRDIEAAIKRPVGGLGLDLSVETRTGDTKPSLRRKQRSRLPNILITTPESFALLLSYSNAPELFAQLQCVVVDEWHELMGSKRGVQLELNISRVREFQPRIQVWGLSATLADPQRAAQHIVGYHPEAGSPRVIDAAIRRPVLLKSLLPETVDRFPWAGHLGLTMLKPLLASLDIEHSTLIFTNTRFQAEKWFQAILDARPEWAGLVALHHSSIDDRNRHFVEESLKQGSIRLVVCTSSLDLGVDFPYVERVVQIGSPKGIARLIQRAGRARHRAGETSEITCVPTNALQLIEFAAVRHAIEQKKIESRLPYENAYDVLSQHLVTCAAGGGFTADTLFRSVTTAASYHRLSRKAFHWVLQLVQFGGANLQAYPEYHKIAESNGRYSVQSRRIEQLHRMNIGTISSDAQIAIRFLKGKRLGYLEEGFLARLRRGDRFVFAGRTLELVRMEDDVALVRLSQKKPNVVAKWSGSRLPISESLGGAMREILSRHQAGRTPRELTALQPLFQAQARLSSLPTADQLLVELCRTRAGWHCFLYPFEGRIVHEGLATLISLRLSRHHKATFALSVDDYGIEILSKTRIDFRPLITPALFSCDHLLDDIIESVNLSNLAKRQFRDIARIAGLVLQNYPGNRHSSRQLQNSASLLYEVFQRHDPDNLLLTQSREETLAQFYELTRLQRCLERLGASQLRINDVTQPPPFAFPLVVERISALLSNESLAEQIQRMKEQWEQAE